ncbi:hypothetical protein [Micromonospora rubida]
MKSVAAFGVVAIAYPAQATIARRRGHRCERQSGILVRQRIDARVRLPATHPDPSPDHLRKYLARWREGDNEKIDAALKMTFEAMPRNEDVGEVGVKIAALNGLYSTNIFGVVRVASPGHRRHAGR